MEAYQAIKSECIGASFRKHGGPLLRVISETDAEIILEKERSVERM